ncbi:organic solvent tolerance protein OstA [Rhodopirellula sp.]|nr:organic solvent tolerance protein OstA [Rhodopirellula sp.]MDB4678959.1 organic solvent tolerance protein OstA [Rhodopirellula sp.]
MGSLLVGNEATTVYERVFHVFECRRLGGFLRALITTSVLLLSPITIFKSIGAEVNLVSPLAAGNSLQIQGTTISRWDHGEAEASLIEGNCEISLSGQRLKADRVLLVVDGPAGRVRSRVVFVQSQHDSTNGNDVPSVFICLTDSEPQIIAPNYRRASSHQTELMKWLPSESAEPAPDKTNILPVQYEQSEGSSKKLDSLNGDRAQDRGLQFLVGGGTRAVEMLARGATTPPQVETINRPELGETVILARGGVTVLVRDVAAQLATGDLMELGTVSISADRVVGWLPLVTNLFNGTADLSQAQGELYLEGDIVFRQGERIIYAESMYYNVAMERGIVLDAEAITTVPNYNGVVRLKADVLQQVAKGNFIAFDAAITSSRMGVPRYWLQSQQLTLRDRERSYLDPVSGSTKTDREPFVDSSNNFVYFSGVPILYWPKFSTSLERPTSYVSSVRLNSDSVFGTQFLVDLDLFQLLGIQSAPKGAEWDLSLDYFSDRGAAVGTNFDYDLTGFLGSSNQAKGFLDAWFIHDEGSDTLGNLRRNLTPEHRTRGRTLFRHRQTLGESWQLSAELGWVSDRNFLEQYLEQEWDQDTDHRTELHLRRYHHSHLLDLTLSGRVNDFYTTTEKLPQLDHYLLGGSLLGERLTVTGHSKVGYQRLKVAELPSDPTEAALYSPVPGEIESKGVVASTRQEVALPFQAGPVRLVPSLSGEASHFGQDVNGEPLTRLLGQAGFTASLSAWKADPSIQSALLNVRGLAHKVEWTAGYFYGDSNTNLDELPLYDPLDDNAQEQFRSRFITSSFGGALDPRYDPRSYALRQGSQWLMASPSDIIADDLQQFRFGLHQRWQTKRGLQGRERIVDLLQLDLDTYFFPEADRDNFGESWGPTTYNMLYHVGDRFTILSDGYFDLFQGGLQSVSAGFRTSRPGMGELYVGLLSLKGPIDSTVLRSNVDYRLNEKWIASAGAAYDFEDTGNIGQTISVTRIGESMLLRVGVNVDEGRDNVGIGFAIEPRFWPSPRLGRLGGSLIPPPGIDGVE